MKNEVFLTCAVTGAGDTVGKHPDIPVTPEQIATAAIEAAKAGAAIAHCHVRDPETGRGSRNLDHYREVADRIRSSGTDVILNFTTGMGGDLSIGPGENPMQFGNDTDLIGPLARLEHVDELLPEICTLDCGTLNFGEGNAVYVGTPDQLRAGCKRIQELGVKPELEVFDTGHLWMATKLIEEGLVDDPPMVQICLGIPYGAPAEMNTFMSMVNAVPQHWIWSAFAISRKQMPWVAAAAVAGGNVRVGLEDNLYLDRGVFASNAQLVERAVNILTLLGVKVMGPDGAREKLGLKAR